MTSTPPYIEDADNRYRWYLCTQTTPSGWICEHKSTVDILQSVGTVTDNSPTTLVPIYKFIPTAMDQMILQRMIRDITRVKVIR